MNTGRLIMAKIIPFPKRKNFRTSRSYYNTHDCIDFINHNEFKKAALALSIILDTDSETAEKSLNALTQAIRKDKNKLDLFLDLEEILNRQMDAKISLLLLYDLFGLDDDHAHHALVSIKKTARLKP